MQLCYWLCVRAYLRIKILRFSFDKTVVPCRALSSLRATPQTTYRHNIPPSRLSNDGVSPVVVVAVRCVGQPIPGRQRLQGGFDGNRRSVAVLEAGTAAVCSNGPA